MSILNKLGLAKLSELRSAETQFRQVEAVNQRLAVEVQAMSVRVVEAESRCAVMADEEAKQKRGNGVLWMALSRSHRLKDAPDPGSIREALRP